MKGWIWLLGIVAAVLLGLGLLVWSFPAAWAGSLLQRRLPGATLQGLHGTVWHGRADEVLGPQGRPLGQLQWQLSRRALLGDSRLHFDLRGPWLDASGSLAHRDQLTTYRDVSIHTMPAQWPVPVHTPWGSPRGRVDVQVTHATLQGNWPLALQARAQWRQAAVQTAQGVVALGNLQLHLEGQSGVIRGAVRDDGNGPLGVRGNLSISPLGWRYTLALTPRGADPALRQWLRRVGPAVAGGSVHLAGAAGLAGILPTASTPAASTSGGNRP